MPKEYASMRLDKISDTQEMEERFNHNYRIYDVDNADPRKKHLNQEVVDTFGKTYETILDETISHLKRVGAIPKLKGKNEYYKIRDDAVLGFEVVLRYSESADSRIPKDEWVKANVEWLNRAFNPPSGKYTWKDEHGVTRSEKADNVKAVIVHNDEGPTHIHAFVVPINEKGRLAAKSYNNGSRRMRALQDDYAKAMARFGLERGERYSVATAQKVSEYYRGLKRAVDSTPPEKEQDESDQEYYKRLSKAWQTHAIHQQDELEKTKQQYNQSAAARIDAFRRSHALDEESVENAKLLASQLGQESLTKETATEIARVMQEHTYVQKALEYDDAMHPGNVDAYRQATETYVNLGQWLLEEERERSRQQKQQTQSVANEQEQPDLVETKMQGEQEDHEH